MNVITFVSILALQFALSNAFIETNIIQKQTVSVKDFVTEGLQRKNPEISPQSPRNKVSLGLGFFGRIKQSRKQKSNSNSNPKPKSKSKAKSKAKKHEATAKIDTIVDTNDFLKFISEDERLCIIKFRAAWCKSCKKFDVKFHHLANEVADKVDESNQIVQEGKVRLADVEFGVSRALIKSLGIKKLPYIHMYKGSKGKLCDFVCGPASFQVLVNKMNQYLEEGDTFDNIMEAGSELMDEHLPNKLYNQFNNSDVMLGTL